jgi:hypothetical protein
MRIISVIQWNSQRSSDNGKIFAILCVKDLLTNGIVSKNLGKFYFFRYGHATMWLIGGNCVNNRKIGDFAQGNRSSKPFFYWRDQGYYIISVNLARASRRKNGL